MNHEQRIKESRTIEAMKNGYMGLEGKFVTIAKRLGQPIMQQSGIYAEATYLENPCDLKEEEEILTMDEFDQSYETGMQFDGLSRGINMSISVHYHLREILVRFKGSIVYKEVSGDLEGYVPNEEWEKEIERLFVLARNREKLIRPIEKKEAVEQNERKKKDIFNYLKTKWGLQ